jgi:hypothetical protein
MWLRLKYYSQKCGGIGSNGLKKSAPMAIENIKILGAVLELQAEQHCRFG